MSRDVILRAVEAADGWQFVPSHSFVKIPGLTEPADIMRMSPVLLAGLADQLIFQIDQSEKFSFSSTHDGQAIVSNNNPEGEESNIAVYRDESRSLNALCAMSKARFF